MLLLCLTLNIPPHYTDRISVHTYSLKCFYLLFQNLTAPLSYILDMHPGFYYLKEFQLFFFLFCAGVKFRACTCFIELVVINSSPLVMIFTCLSAHLPNSPIVGKDECRISRWRRMCIFHRSWQDILEKVCYTAHQEKVCYTLHPCDEVEVSLRKVNCKKFLAL